jgi:hypothetical protein
MSHASKKADKMLETNLFCHRKYWKSTSPMMYHVGRAAEILELMQA